MVHKFNAMVHKCYINITTILKITYTKAKVIIAIRITHFIVPTFYKLMELLIKSYSYSFSEKNFEVI